MINANDAGFGEIIMAISGLGIASAALVDATKALPGGGVSAKGFAEIHELVARFVPDADRQDGTLDAAILPVLHANWINGMALADQKAVAKSLIKLRLTRDNAARYATVTDVDATLLAEVADRMQKGEALRQEPATDAERQQREQQAAEHANVLGRFDLALAALLDGAYQRADQRYRNVSKLLAGIVAVVLSVAGGAILESNAGSTDLLSLLAWLACGVLAVPLAPVAKDLTSALQAGVKVAQSLRRP